MQDGAIINGIGTVLIVLVILWLALHSAKIIFAVFVNLFVGLAITTAVGLMMVGSLNLLSIAFAVLFVGLGVDFGIQFSVRYRSERFKNDDLTLALENAARALGGAAVAGGDGDRGRLPLFPADRLQGHFRARQDRRRRHAGRVPHQHHGAAGAARTCSIRPARSEPVGYAFLAPVDHFLEKHRVIIIVGTLLVAVAGLPLLYFMKFDFNPINLRNPKVESIATFLDLRKDPNTGANAINVMTQFGSRREEDRGEAGEGAGSAARDVARQFRADRPAGKAEADRAGRQGAQSRAQSGLGRCRAFRRGERRGA